MLCVVYQVGKSLRLDLSTDASPGKCPASVKIKLVLSTRMTNVHFFINMIQ